MKNPSDTRKILDAITSSGEWSRMNGKLLQSLAFAVGRNAKTQQRFRISVLTSLSRIETMLQMIHGAQIVEAHRSKPDSEAKIKEHATSAQEYVSHHSKEIGLKMVQYVYDDSEPQIQPRETGRKRRQSLSYEI